MARTRPAEVTGYRNDGVGTAVALINAVTTAESPAETLGPLLASFNFKVDVPLTSDEVEALATWARGLRPVFVEDDQERAIGLLNEVMVDVPMQPHISDHGLGPHLHYGRPGAGLVDRVRANTAVALAFVLCEYGGGRLGVCADAGCERVYADISRGPRRRYCSKTCLNRNTVAAYRARRSVPQGEGPA
ncbi:CGNR zinc finger domain-containing protein [Spongiactinospora rosea]|uniref:CGNR zinc finger domain-containing protein n=1 Tax=Spongiactinospora rosea TaxID=2248750 RepID=A0A366LNP2_9ACTN|nr:CGNR zinc finger domain-containing protein [Spongiactinospora rosea]